MQGSTHLLGGAAAAAAFMVASQADVPTYLLAQGMAIGAVGGLLPDIDHRGSKISRKFRLTGTIISALFTHRGVFHAPALYIVLWSFLGAVYASNAQWLMLINFLFIGILSHLCLDSLNPAGIPMFFPVTKKKVRILAIRTGGWFEWIVRAMMAMLCIILPVLNNPNPRFPLF